MDDQLAAVIVERYRERTPYREITAELGVHHPVVSRVVREKIPEAERKRIASEIQKAAQADRADIAELRARLLRNRTPCGAPGCDDPDCPVDHGHCHYCGRPVEVAEYTAARERWVKGHPKRYCSRDDCVGWRARLGDTGRRIIEEVGVGACGCVGHPADCPVEKYHCHYCDKLIEPERRFAKHTYPAIPAVQDYPNRYCSKACERRDRPDLVSRLLEASSGLFEDPRRRARWLLKRHGKTSAFGHLGGRPSKSKLDDEHQILEDIRSLDAKGRSAQNIADILSTRYSMRITRKMVRRQLRRLAS